jgi:tetratricopeptide (TPR) repeat protein
MHIKVWIGSGLCSAVLLSFLSGCGSEAYLVPPGPKPHNVGVLEDQQVVEMRYRTIQFNIQRAISTEESALVADPHWAEGYNRLADLFWEENQPAAALAEMTKACQLDPHNLTYWDNLGAMAVRQHEWHQAASAYGQSLARNPAQWQAEVGLGLTALGQHNVVKAQSYAQQALAAGGPQGPVYALFGQVSQGLGNWTSAATYYRNTIAANPDWWQGYYDMALVEVHWGEIPQAESNIRQALHDSPENPQPWLLLQSLPQTMQ